MGLDYYEPVFEQLYKWEQDVDDKKLERKDRNEIKTKLHFYKILFNTSPKLKAGYEKYKERMMSNVE